MEIPIGLSHAIDNSYPVGNRSNYPSRTAEPVPTLPAAMDTAYEGRDGRSIIFSADGDSAEFSNIDIPETPYMEIPHTAMPGGDGFRMPDFGSIVFFSPDGDFAQLSFNPADKEDEPLPAGATPGLEDPKPCETCASRKYVDGSDDPSVSFKTPTKLNSGSAAAKVAAHENEHVHHERSKAEREGRRITHQSVTFHYDTCPECGKNYIAGGTTRTRSVSDPEEEKPEEMEDTGYEPPEESQPA